MSTAWSHLPNAMHIDRILASVKAHPKTWYVARDAAWYAAAPGAAHCSGTWRAAYDAARHAAYDAARHAAWDAAYAAAYNAARGAIAVLIAWDDSSKYLDMPSDQLKMWYYLTERPACLLLLPAVMAFEQIEELELA